MNWYLIKENIVINSIVYDGIAPYTPEPGVELKSTNNVYNIGDAWTE